MCFMNINSKKKIVKSNKKEAIYTLSPRIGYFDSSEIKILKTFKIKEGVLVIYRTKKPFCLGGALFDKNTNELIYRTANPIFQTDSTITKIQLQIQDDALEFSFKQKGKEEKEIFLIDYILGKNIKKYKEQPINTIKCIIHKADCNPLITPNAANVWECCGTFNPAVVNIDDVVHILYRAVGGDGGSVLGYAKSRNGINIDERLSYPVYRPTGEFELKVNKNPEPTFPYSSGSSYECWGGCEDPRLAKIEDTLYMIYTAFNGIHPPCVSLTSIKVDDFLNKKWHKWKKPVLVSPKNQMNKNWVIFPEKIKGKYAILHSITPNIQIEYLDDLEFKENPNIKSIYIPVKKKGVWDTVVRGAGSTPLRIDEGWLVFYHAINEKEPGRYKIGAMILDYNDPTKILYKSSFPIIEPDRKYENEGYKGGIVYTCGAVIKGEEIILYYGGADTVVCAASCNLKKFIQQIKENNGKI